MRYTKLLTNVDFWKIVKRLAEVEISNKKIWSFCNVCAIWLIETLAREYSR